MGNAALALVGAQIIGRNQIGQVLASLSLGIQLRPDSSGQAAWREIYQEYLEIKSREG